MARQEVGVNALAAKCGMSRATVTAVKTGKTCSDQTAKKLAEGLGVPLAALLEE